VVDLTDDAGPNKPKVAGCDDLSIFFGKGVTKLSEHIQMEIELLLLSNVCVTREKEEG
jgi:hypothetical protein